MFRLPSNNIVIRIFGALATGLPLSFINKLSDGKLSREELMELIREVTLIVTKEFEEVYNELNPDEDDIILPRGGDI